MRALFYLALLVLFYFAMTSGLRFCWNGQCQEIKIEVINNEH